MFADRLREPEKLNGTARPRFRVCLALPSRLLASGSRPFHPGPPDRGPPG